MARAQVKLNMRGIVEVLNDDGVIADCERRAKAIAQDANDAAKEHYKNLGYEKAEMFVTKTTRTSKYGNKEVIVFANPGVHAGTEGAPIGDYAQANYSVLTQAIDAGRD